MDGTSFALMRQQRMQHAFAFDTHFVTAGFLRIPQDFNLAGGNPGMLPQRHMGDDG